MTQVILVHRVICVIAFHLCHLRLDSTSGIRRLLTSTDGVNHGDFYQWSYDRFGNRTSEHHIPPPGAGSSSTLTYMVGSDSRLLSQTDPNDPTQFRRYLTDQAGQRLATLDNSTGVFGLWGGEHVDRRRPALLLDDAGERHGSL